jgi:uncharacterized membrane protein
MQIPSWALSVSFWLHMIATITWFGGIGVYSLIAIPIIEKQFSSATFAKFISAVNRKLDPIGWFSLAILTFTGMFQMSSNTNYQGFLNFQSDWAGAILLKHIVFVIVLWLSGIYTWKISPKLEREIFKLSQNVSDTKFSEIYQQSKKTKNLSFIFGILILLFTAVSRIS